MKDLIFLLWYYCCRYVLIILPDNVFFQITSFLTHKRLGFKFTALNLKDPKTFNEKLNYLKAQRQSASYTMLADKILVRDHIKSTIGERYLVPELGVYHTANEIDFEKLPSSFI